MSKTSYQHDFAFSYGEDVSPKLARKVMRDVYKMVEYKKALEVIKSITLNNHDHDTIRINNICNEALEDE